MCNAKEALRSVANAFELGGIVRDVRVCKNCCMGSRKQLFLR